MMCPTLGVLAETASFRKHKHLLQKTSTVLHLLVLAWPVIVLAALHTVTAASGQPYKMAAPAAKSGRRQQRTSSSLTRAQVLELIGKYSPATTLETCILPEDRSSTLSNESVQSAWFAIGNQLVKEQQKELEALHAYTCSLLHEPKCVECLIGISQIVSSIRPPGDGSGRSVVKARVGSSRSRDAHAIARSAVDVNPNHAGALFAAGVSAAEQLRDHRQTEVYMRQIVSLGDRAGTNLTANEWYVLGDALMKLHEPEKAYHSFREACRLDPEHAGHAYRLYMVGNRLGYAEDLRREYLGTQDSWSGKSTFYVELDRLRSKYRLEGSLKGAVASAVATTCDGNGNAGACDSGTGIARYRDGLRQRAAVFLDSPEVVGILRRTGAIRQRMVKFLQASTGGQSCKLIRENTQARFLRGHACMLFEISEVVA